ncbi:hypothetical protein LCGC14_2528240, partial [marine sediment metagenome]
YGGWPKDKNTVFRIIGGKDLVIDGRGSTLMIHGLHQPFYLENCRNVTIRNLKIDWKQPPAMTGKVVAREGRHIDVEILDDVPVAGGEPFFALQTYDPKTWLPTASETFAGVQSTELLRPKVLRLNMTNDGRGNIHAPVGWLLAMRHILVGCEPFEVRECDGVRLEDVDLYSGPGMGITGVGTKDISLHRVRIIRKPGSKRIVSTTGDATHFINCSGTIELKDGKTSIEVKWGTIPNDGSR